MNADTVLRHIYWETTDQTAKQAIEIYFREQGLKVGPPYQMLGLD